MSYNEDILGVFNELIVDYEHFIFEGKNNDNHPSLLIEVPETDVNQEGKAKQEDGQESQENTQRFSSLSELLNKFQQANFKSDKEFYQYFSYAFFTNQKERKNVQFLFDLHERNQNQQKTGSKPRNNIIESQLQGLCDEWYNLGLRTANYQNEIRKCQKKRPDSNQ